jgi:hypothetical protein
MLNSNETIDLLIEHLALKYNAVTNFDSPDSGEKMTANFKVSIVPSSPILISSADGEYFRENYPDGFEILRISNYQQFQIPMTLHETYAVSFSMEIQKKPEQIEEEEVIEDEDETTISTRNKAVIDAYLGDDAEEQFASYSDAHKIILNKQMDLLRDLFAIASGVSKK